jgi:hypothetical protein
MLLYQKKLNKNAVHVYNTIPLEDWTPLIKEKYSFYYNWCDHVYDIQFSNFLEETHINFLKENPTIKVIYDFNGEPILGSVIDEIVLTSKKWNLNSNQIVITVSNELQTQFVNERVTNDTITTIEHNCDIKNLVIAPKRDNIPFKKFSTMCRIHRPWRSYIVCRLKEQKLLEEFHYSFLGCYNDMDDAIKKALEENLDITLVLKNGDWKIITAPDRIKDDLKNICNYEISKEISKFIDLCPHYIEKDNFKTDIETPQELLSSGIHLIIENGFFDLKESSYTTRSIELGEKTWKAIMTLKPFLAYSDVQYLKNIKKLGFKTFSPYIDENYDNETDPKNRAELIIKEIERINSLSMEEFNQLLENCKDITEHNFQLYLSIREQVPEFSEIDFTKL